MATKEMDINEVYKRWVLQEHSHYLPKGTSLNDIEKVRFSSRINDVSNDPYDTFSGCEMWLCEVYLKNRPHEHYFEFIQLWDINPAGSIAYFMKNNDIHPIFPKEEPSLEELVNIEIRRH